MILVVEFVVFAADLMPFAEEVFVVTIAAADALKCLNALKKRSLEIQILVAEQLQVMAL